MKDSPLEIIEEATYEVYDPWTAQIRGVFHRKEDAELFLKALTKLKKKRGWYET